MIYASLSLDLGSKKAEVIGENRTISHWVFEYPRLIFWETAII